MAEPSDQEVPGEVLSESDVQQLLSEVAPPGAGSEGPPPGEQTRGSAPPADGAMPYDFRRPTFLSTSDLRKLRLSHEDFIRSLAARISIYLRIEFSLEISKLQTLTFHQFVESLPNPAHVTLCKIEPLRGICLLDVHPRLGMTVVDRLLGGPGNVSALVGELGEIDITLLDQVVNIIMQEWCNHWRPIQELQSSLIGHENNPRFLQTSPRDAVMLVLSMKARIGECEETIQLAAPFYTLEPLVRRYIDSSESSEELPSEPKGPAPRWDHSYDEVKVPVTAEWRGIEMTAAQLARLKPGDMVMLDPKHASEVVVRLASLPKFVGKPGTIHNQWAVQLSKVTPTRPVTERYPI